MVERRPARVQKKPATYGKHSGYILRTMKRSKTGEGPLLPERYEAALLERLTWPFPPPLFRVEGKRDGQAHKHMRHSGNPRQLDVAVYRGDALVLVADAKRHETRSLDIADVDAFVGMLDDVGCKFGILASPRGFTKGAKRRAAITNIELLLLTYEEALTAELLPVARRIYSSDWAYHPNLASALLAINRNEKWKNIAEKLETIPFEEWERFAEYAMVHHPAEAIEFLRMVSLNHHDDGWRFNAARLLIEGGMLDESLRLSLIEKEKLDPDFLALLHDAV